MEREHKSRWKGTAVAAASPRTGIQPAAGASCRSHGTARRATGRPANRKPAQASDTQRNGQLVERNFRERTN